MLTLNLEDEIVDRSVSDMQLLASSLMNGQKEAMGLDQILDALLCAQDDDNITGIVIRGQAVNTDYAIMSELRRAIVDFRSNCGKPVYFYDNGISAAGMYIASAADSIFITPLGSVALRGVTSNKMYFKGLADKVGVGFDVVKHGRYKSAIESFTQNDISKEDREQTQRYVDMIWREIRDSIASGRGVEASVIDKYVDEIKYISTADYPMEIGLIDGAMYRDEFLQRLRTAIGIEEDKEIPSISIASYGAKEDEVAKPKNQIAIVYALGEIKDGSNKSDYNNIYGEDLARELRKVRTNEDIKAIVLRVNSPGGSALASDIIWREVKLTSEVKPVVVSMGGYAASGGYYISCAADFIMAENATLTGSIGVFGLIPNMQKLSENMGVSQAPVSSNKNPLLLGYKSLTPNQLTTLQSSVDNTYDTFVGRVAEGRQMSRQAVDSIAQGRVWTGLDAVSNGLVDEIGGIYEALDVAAELASLDGDYEVVALPEQKDSPFDMAMRMMNVQNLVQTIFPHLASKADKVENMLEYSEHDFNFKIMMHM